MKTRLITVKHTESTFHSMQNTATAVTVTYGISDEGLELEDPSNEPNYDDLLVMSTTPEKAPDKAEYVTMTFEKVCLRVSTAKR